MQVIIPNIIIRAFDPAVPHEVKYLIKSDIVQLTKEYKEVRKFYTLQAAEEMLNKIAPYMRDLKFEICTV